MKLKNKGAFSFFFCTDRNNTVFFLLRKVETLNLHSPQKKEKKKCRHVLPLSKKVF